MIRKIWAIFRKDLKVNLKDSIALNILFIPILLAVLINLFTPAINETTVDFALLEGDNPSQISYLEQFAEVELFKTIDQVQRRVEERDATIGIVPENGGYYLMTQGNEPEGIVDYAKILTSFYELDISMEETNSELFDFERTVPPLIKTLVNTMILLISILGGMLIALNIVEEKADNTSSAINVTPTGRLTFILEKV